MYSTMPMTGIRYAAHVLRRDWLLILAGILILCLVTLPQWLAVVGDDPIEYRNTIAHVNNPDRMVRSGMFLQYTIEQCNNEGGILPLVVHRQLIEVNSDKHYTLFGVNGLAEEGCRTETFNDMIPNVLPEGEYKLVIVASADGRWKNVNARFETEPFTVTKQPVKAPSP